MQRFQNAKPSAGGDFYLQRAQVGAQAEGHEVGRGERGQLLRPGIVEGGRVRLFRRRHAPNKPDAEHVMCAVRCGLVVVMLLNLRGAREMYTRTTRRKLCCRWTHHCTACDSNQNITVVVP